MRKPDYEEKYERYFSGQPIIKQMEVIAEYAEHSKNRFAEIWQDFEDDILIPAGVTYADAWHMDKDRQAIFIDFMERQEPFQNWLEAQVASMCEPSGEREDYGDDR